MAEKRYFSETPGIWRDKVTKSQRRPQVTDKELLRRRGEPSVDCFGNLLTNRREDIARILVERAMLELTPGERAAVSPARRVRLMSGSGLGCAFNFSALATDVGEVLFQVHDLSLC